MKIVHKVNGTKWRKGCCWNSQKVDVQSFVLQLRLARVRNTALPQRVSPVYQEKFHILHTFLRLLSRNWADLQKYLCEKKSQSFPNRLRSVSTVFSWPLLLKSTSGQRDQDRSAFGLWWPGSQRSSVAGNTENELKSFHNETNREHFVWMQDFWMLLKLDNISWQEMLEIWHNFMQCPVVNTLPREEASQPKGLIQGNTKIGPVLEVATCCVHGKYGVQIRISSVNRELLTLGSQFLMDQTSLWWIWTTMSRKFRKFCSNNMRSNWHAKNFACRSKTKEKPQRSELAGSSPRTVPIKKSTWTDVEPV